MGYRRQHAKRSAERAQPMPTPIDHAMTVGLKAVGLLIGCFVLTLIGLFVLGIVTTFAMHS